MITFSFMALQVTCCLPHRPSIHNNNQQYLNSSFTSSAKSLLLRTMQRVINIGEDVSNTTAKILDSLVDSAFVFDDQPLLESQQNFAPVDELVGGPAVIDTIEGHIPDDFPEGAYIRNGANPLFGGLKSAKSALFGKSNQIWIEGEGMLHALYITKNHNCRWTFSYNNKYIETESFKQEILKQKPSFIPIMEGDLTAVVVAVILNMLRFGKINKHVSNTNVFEHSGKLYSIAECHLPHEIDVSTLKTLGNWNLSKTWNRPFTSHPKRAPESGELVIIGADAIKPPYVELGVISVDGKKLVHRADLKLGRCTFCHDFGVTQRYNIFMDFPLTINVLRLFQGGQLIKYNKEEYARIGVMPRYGDADSMNWFNVEPNCTFHIINCFEDGHEEVVVWGCRALDTVLPFGSLGVDGSLVHDRPYEWRLNMKTGKVKERNLTVDSEFSMEVPLINEKFSGIKNRFGYTQVFKSIPSTCTTDNIPKFNGLAKLDFEQVDKGSENLIKVEYHMFENNTFCTGATFIPKQGGLEEDDGWIGTYVHNETTNISQVFVIDAKKFSGEPVAKITLPSRVPYGFHGAFIPSSLNYT